MVTTIGGVREWPTTERFAEATRALSQAHDVLEKLEYAFRQLNGEYDPSDIARESVPVTAETIAAGVEFVMETEITVQEIAELQHKIAEWPGLMAHVRAEQNLARRDDA
jgi:cell fate (sporulation/competence/biofilm development) regulator YlbF (YheA/YmcA/DUF963 family)